MNDDRKKLELKKKIIRPTQVIDQNLLEKGKLFRAANHEKRRQDDLVVDENNQHFNPNPSAKVILLNACDKKYQVKSRYICNYPYRIIKVPAHQGNELDATVTDASPINKLDEINKQEHKKNENIAVKVCKPITKVNQTNRWKTKALVSKKNCRNGSKTGGRPPLFPSSLPPFDNPKDGLLKTLLQMENPEWEVVMLGLQGLVRLCRHHSKLVTASSHSVIQSLVNNIRNLRSQVSRGSCQVAKELFDKVGRFLDAELEDLAGTLLCRTADTNKFLRGDALSALESMVDHTNPVRSVGVLINKGAKHQNALVRCSTARLLLRLAKKLGAERTLSLPRETKDMLVITTAKLLTEGSLDTRYKCIGEGIARGIESSNA